MGAAGSLDLSLEAVPELQADHLFILKGTGTEETAERFLDHPLWRNLPAVARGNVYSMPTTFSLGYYTTLNTLEKAADATTGETN